MFSLLNLQSLFGLVVVVAACWALSENRRAFPWKLALGAVAVQAGLVLAVFGIPGSQAVLNAINGAVDGLARSLAQGPRRSWPRRCRSLCARSLCRRAAGDAVA